MKHVFFWIIALAMALTLNAQKTVRMDAVKGNDYGVTYTLPKTIIEVTIDYSKKTKTAGQFYMYAERYLNINNPILESSVEYQLEKLDANAAGIPDTQNSFLVEFRPNSAMAYVTLTQDGMICAINGSYTFPDKTEEEAKQPKTRQINAHQFFTEEILRAGSTAKQAELIAKQIYRLRESRNEVLTGEADNMPPDGDSYKLVMQQLDEQEAALTELFTGSENTESMKKTIRINVDRKEINEGIIARFSKKLGVVEPNDLAGEAIHLTLKPKQALQPLLLSIKDSKEREKKFSKGIVYNIPGKATLQLDFNNKSLVNKECDVVQYGSQEVLEQKQFGDKNNPLKVIFYPEMGAIKQTGLAR